MKIDFVPMQEKAGYRILLTSDFHLGVKSFGQSVLPEQIQFLNWFLEELDRIQPDALVFCGDMFDRCISTMDTPEAFAAQRAYFNFLNKIRIPTWILAGNHDSIPWLEASKARLPQENIHIIGNPLPANKTPVLLKNNAGAPQAILFPIPGPPQLPMDGLTTEEDICRASNAANQRLYNDAWNAAADLRKLNVPTIMTGHMVASNYNPEEVLPSKSRGSLSPFPASMYPPATFIGLGHYHPGHSPIDSMKLYYIGAPITVAFNEENYHRQYVLLERTADGLNMSINEVPLFVDFRNFEGDFKAITEYLAAVLPTPPAPATYLNIKCTEPLTQMQIDAICDTANLSASKNHTFKVLNLDCPSA